MNPQVEELESDECWRLLATETLGRVATATDRGVRIWPVNYGVHEHSILFRSDPGSKVWDIAVHPNVSFEIDGVENGQNWSVVVTGRAEVVDDALTGEHRERDEVLTVNPGPKRMLLQITPKSVSGRRFSSALARGALWNDRPVEWRTPN
jgi:nitroimidazol reductase NimA-like FMN-containing flavoprotein (pyridoxamine 5'-phosphate oxidase superfamily)